MGSGRAPPQNPKYPAAAKWDDSTRPAILFDPTTGQDVLAALEAAFRKAVPFSANHNGAPWLEPIHQDENGERTSEPAKPGEQGRWSLCPDNAEPEASTISTSSACPLRWPRSRGKSRPIVDKDGLIYVLHEEERLTRANDDLKFRRSSAPTCMTAWTCC